MKEYLKRSHDYPISVFYRNGVGYKRCGWLGCQLESIERRKPVCRERRKLDFGVGKPAIEIEVYSIERIGFFKYRIAWRICPYTVSIDEYEKKIHHLIDLLKNSW